MSLLIAVVLPLVFVKTFNVISVPGT